MSKFEINQKVRKLKGILNPFTKKGTMARRCPTIKDFPNQALYNRKDNR